MFNGSSHQSKTITMKKTPELLFAFVLTFFFSFSSALLHGSMLLLFALPLFVTTLSVVPRSGAWSSFCKYDVCF